MCNLLDPNQNNKQNERIAVEYGKKIQQVRKQNIEKKVLKIFFKIIQHKKSFTYFSLFLLLFFFDKFIFRIKPPGITFHSKIRLGLKAQNFAKQTSMNCKIETTVYPILAACNFISLKRDCVQLNNIIFCIDDGLPICIYSLVESNTHQECWREIYVREPKNQNCFYAPIYTVLILYTYTLYTNVHQLEKQSFWVRLGKIYDFFAIAFFLH